MDCVYIMFKCVCVLHFCASVWPLSSHLTRLCESPVCSEHVLVFTCVFCVTVFRCETAVISLYICSVCEKLGDLRSNAFCVCHCIVSVCIVDSSVCTSLCAKCNYLPVRCLSVCWMCSGVCLSDKISCYQKLLQKIAQNDRFPLRPLCSAPPSSLPALCSVIVCYTLPHSIQVVVVIQLR